MWQIFPNMMNIFPNMMNIWYSRFLCGNIFPNIAGSTNSFVVKINETVLKFGQFWTKIDNGKHSETPCERHRAISFLQQLIQPVQFIEIWKSQRDDWRSFRTKSFIAQGMAKTTIYWIMKRYERTGRRSACHSAESPFVVYEHNSLGSPGKYKQDRSVASASGRHATKMTRCKKR